MSYLPMCLLCYSFTLNVFQHAILSVHIEGQKVRKIFEFFFFFVYQRQCLAFGKMIPALLAHSLLKSCHKNKLFPFEINFDLVFCSQPSVAASLFLVGWVGILLSFLNSLSDILLLLTQRRRKNWFENSMRSSVRPMRRWVWGFCPSWWLKDCCLKKDSTYKCYFFMDPILAGGSLIFFKCLMIDPDRDVCVC